jgi:uncharacterized protein involved in oxidation of intracellular sulfur
VKILFIITTDDRESIFNAMRLANVGVEKGDEVSVFMLGKRGVLFERSGSEQFFDQVKQNDIDRPACSQSDRCLQKSTL